MVGVQRNQDPNRQTKGCFFGSHKQTPSAPRAGGSGGGGGGGSSEHERGAARCLAIQLQFLDVLPPNARGIGGSEGQGAEDA